jgi:hypothetical protein
VWGSYDYLSSFFNSFNIFTTEKSLLFAHILKAKDYDQRLIEYEGAGRCLGTFRRSSSAPFP